MKQRANRRGASSERMDVSTGGMDANEVVKAKERRAGGSKRDEEEEKREEGAKAKKSS